MRVTPLLRELRGETWKDLVDQVCKSPEASLDQLAFCLVIVRLSGCLTCHTHSYRALRGCTICATHTIRRFRGEDSELIELYNDARLEVETSMNNGKPLSSFFAYEESGGQHGG
jgi:hypothetical protein